MQYAQCGQHNVRSVKYVRNMRNVGNVDIARQVRNCFLTWLNGPNGGMSPNGFKMV